MGDFEQQMREEVGNYQGKFKEVITLAPDFYHLFNNLLADPNLPGRLRPLVLVAIAYYLIPVDIISEDLTGAWGYLDDTYYAALTLETVQQEMGEDDILKQNWEGKQPICDVIDDILAREKELVGDQHDLITWFAGYEYLLKGLKD